MAACRAKPNTALPLSHLPALPSLPSTPLPRASACDTELGWGPSQAPNSSQANASAGHAFSAAPKAGKHSLHGVEDVHNPLEWDPVPGRQVPSRRGWLQPLPAPPQAAKSGAGNLAETLKTGVAQAAAAEAAAEPSAEAATAAEAAAAELAVLESRDVLLRIAADKKRKAADLEKANESPWMQQAREEAQAAWVSYPAHTTPFPPFPPSCPLLQRCIECPFWHSFP